MTQVAAQALGLNNPIPDASSILDMVATDRGVLIPRMSEAQKDAIAAVNGLLVYQTDGTPGFYFYNGTVWKSLFSDNTAWGLNGNSGTGGSNFIGTSDNAAFDIRSGTGAISIGTDAFDKTITLGNTSGATAVNVNTGTGGSTFTTTNGSYALNTGTGAINIGADAAAKDITIGNTSTPASSITLNAGAIGHVVIPDDVQLNLSAADASSTSEGFVLPQSTSTANINANSDEEGKVIWNATDDILNIGTGSDAKSIGIPNGMQIFTSSDAAFTIPANVSRIHVKIWGAGGGGAGGDNATSTGAGPDRQGGGRGGGGAGYSETILSVTPNTPLNITVGVGGPGGSGGAVSAGGNAGTNGTSSSVSGSGFTTVTSNGGIAGRDVQRGGGGGNGDSVDGEDGDRSSRGNAKNGGDGGSSPFGGVGGAGGQVRGDNANRQQRGRAGGFPGGGGGGGREDNADGGDGAGGLVMIYW